ncbi:MAG: UvrABC system protein A [Chlamydiia bacterium]|nr:UvrABC system protein A [Chlamydiia bacterium]
MLNTVAMKKERKITLKGVTVHNLKGVDLSLTIGEMIAFTGVSGSGKSSLAFDTLFIEGQKRYIDSLSKSARRGIGKLKSPDAKIISGLPPTIAIEQKTLSHNPRSTVGTITNIYDHLRLLYAHLAVPYCPVSGEKVAPATEKEIKESIVSLGEGIKAIFLAPFAKGKKGAFKDDMQGLQKKGFYRLYIDGDFYDLSEEIPTLDKEKAHDIDIVIDRCIITKDDSTRLDEATAHALRVGDGVFSLLVPSLGETRVYSLFSFSPKSGIYYKTLESEDFSFNHPKGMCTRCKGLGICEDFDLEKIIDEDQSISEDCCSIAPHYNTVKWGNIFKNLAKIYGFKLTTPWKKLSEKAKQIFLYGTEEKWVKMKFTHPDTGYKWSDYVEWKGAINIAKDRINESSTALYKKKMHDLMDIFSCPDCKGSRLKSYPAAAQFDGLTIAQWSSLSVEDFLSKIKKVKLTKDQKVVAEEIIKEIESRLAFLIDVGLPYLTIDRTSPTLSGGEAQRVRLSGLIGSSLTDVLYILDEPSIGLHPSDNLKLIKTLKALQALGNTIIIVEHDEETILASDSIVDIGPLAGKGGGEVLYNGKRDAFLKEKNSITANYLSGRETISIPKRRKIDLTKGIKIEKASHHNLKEVNLTIPLNVMVAVTGISGSGKSSLISETLYPYLNNKLHKTSLSVGKNKSITGEDLIQKVVSIDQSPIGRTPRSNPATYVGVFTDIRKFFASLPAAKAAGFTDGRFSFNVKEGSCKGCSGNGSIKVDMDFLADVWVECEECKGKRFDAGTLSVTYKGKNISDVLDMSIDESSTFFSEIPSIHKKLSLLFQMGLGYITLGQSAVTLSGGEAQRVKLACELLKKKSSQTLYILDEPTTGLHFYDIQKLLLILHELVDAGNSILVIEHNMDLVKTCDYVIDLGPKGGTGGGKVMACGTPEQVAKQNSPTAPFIKAALAGEKAQVETQVVRKEKEKNIVITGACEHNLKNLSLEIPKEKITVFAGPSGSGKTSLAYNTIFAEAQRRFVETLPPFTRRFVKAMPKPKYGKIENLSPTVAIEQRMRSMNPRSTLGTMAETYDHLRLIYTHEGVAYCPDTHHPIVQITSEYIASQYVHLPEKTKLTILAPINTSEISNFEEWKERFLASGFLRIRLNKKLYELDEEIPYRRLRKNTLELVIDRLVIGPSVQKRLIAGIDLAVKYSDDEVILITEDKEQYFNLSFSVKETGISYPKITHHTFSFNHKDGMCDYCHGLGILIDVDEEMYAYFGCGNEEICPECKGGRLNPLASNVLVENLSLPSLCALSLTEAQVFAKKIKKTDRIKEPLEKLLSTLSFLNEIGLGYLSLNRMTRTLSTGELQRLRLSKELHKELTGACYILDEPTIGLHPVNNELLNKSLLKMKERGNTLLIVEHDPLTMEIADQIIDFGPLCGKNGGEIVFQGSYKQILKDKNSVTGPYLSKKKILKRETKAISATNFLLLEKATIHNIKNLCIDIPLDGITSFTGVSGAGKTSLVIDLLYERLSENLKRRKPLNKLTKKDGVIDNCKVLSKILHINQTPVSLSSRSDISTFLDILSPLRTFFAALPDSKIKGLKAGHFSFNSPLGHCKRCKGHGHEWIDLHFLPPVKLTCSSCNGLRLNPLSLSIKYKGLSISELLQSDVEKARMLFPPLSKITKALALMKDTGLDHLTLNRRVKTLSGGEASRLKITKELTQKDLGHTLYVFDEPTTGLHFTDTELLLKLFDTLLLKGHGIWIIEHNTDIIANSDYIIDLGPGGGSDGGKIVDKGPFKEIFNRKKALIANYLN